MNIRTNGQQSIEFWQAYGYVFENPNWITNVLFGALCVFSTSIVPIVGQIVWLGYCYLIIETLHRRRRTGYPDFDFNLIGQYLVRGIWPFLVSLAFSLIMAPVLFVFALIMIAIIAGIGSSDAGALIVVLVIVASVVGLVIVALLLAPVVTPMMLRAGLTQNLGEGFSFSFLREFLNLVWKELVLIALFLLVTSLIASLVGIALVCVGIYPAMAIVMMAQAHLIWQLYELYLARGGTPIPIKVATPPIRATVVDGGAAPK